MGGQPGLPLPPCATPIAEVSSGSTGWQKGHSLFSIRASSSLPVRTSRFMSRVPRNKSEQNRARVRRFRARWHFAAENFTGKFFLRRKNTDRYESIGRTGDGVVSRLLRIPQEKRKGETKRPKFDKEALHISSSKLLRNRKQASNRYENDEFHQRQLRGAPNFFFFSF